MARNITAAIFGRKQRPFRYKVLGQLASIGQRRGIANVLGFRFSGFFAWWLWRSIYLMKLPSMERKLRVAIDWTLDLFFPRDIVYLRPLHSANGPGITSAETEEVLCSLNISNES